MKITLLSTSDQSGGAAIACMRLADALHDFGHEVRLLVMEKRGNHPRVIEVAPHRRKIDGLLKDIQYAWNKRFLIKPGFGFSANPWWDHALHTHPTIQDADVLNLHWINHGFIGLDALRKLFALQKPMIWHMHDYWAFTGGCHYPGSCTHFETGCGHCLALRKQGAQDLSRQQWLQKQALFQLNPPVLVGASAWLTQEAAKSALVQSTAAQAQHICNPIDLTYYTAADKAAVRTAMGLSPHKKYVLFAAMNTADPRKGFNQLISALKTLEGELAQTTELLVAGKTNLKLIADTSFKVHFLGALNQDGMRNAYRAATAFVIPSLEENLPNTILESLACGTPVAGFEVGGIPEMVQHGRNGFLAPVGDAAALGNAIRSTLLLSESSLNTASSILAFESSVIAEKYTVLANGLLKM
ncbi:MAG: glycosyltransferase [Sphingobacteriaceae bacterium]|nr:glycosyltransferase [Sphingobacteriaceae bacterium]